MIILKDSGISIPRVQPAADQLWVMRDHIRALVTSILDNPLSHQWLMHPEGTFWTPLSSDTSLHVWNRKDNHGYAPEFPEAHPWHTSFYMVAGFLTHTRFKEKRSLIKKDKVYPPSHQVTTSYQENGKNRLENSKAKLQKIRSVVYSPGEVAEEKPGHICLRSFTQAAVALVTHSQTGDFPSIRRYTPLDLVETAWLTAFTRPAKGDEVVTMATFTKARFFAE